MLIFFQNLRKYIDSFSPESRLIGIGRTIVAMSQLSFLMLTPASFYIVPVGSPQIDLKCSEGVIRGYSIYCILPYSAQTVSYIVCFVLFFVAIGIYPRITGVFHFWASFSVASSISLPDGGEAMVQVVTFFLMFVLLGDSRRWHWSKSASNDVCFYGRASKIFRSISWAGMWVLCLQISYVYINSALTKLSVEQWKDGTATYYVSRMELFGAAGLFDDFLRGAFSIPLIALASTWGTIVVEIAIAILILLPYKLAARIAVALSFLLHLIIALMIGIFSFAVIMFGSVFIACALRLDKNSSFNKGRDLELGCSEVS